MQRFEELNIKSLEKYKLDFEGFHIDSLRFVKALSHASKGLNTWSSNQLQTPFETK